jgi:hypothetical protein
MEYPPRTERCTKVQQQCQNYLAQYLELEDMPTEVWQYVYRNLVPFPDEIEQAIEILTQAPDDLTYRQQQLYTKWRVVSQKK